MPGPSAVRITLSPSDHASLTRLARGHNTPAKLVRRARIVLLAAAGHSNAGIGRHLGVDVQTVRTWRRRWAASPRLLALADQHRSGRPSRIRPETRAKLISIACRRASDDDKTPFRDVWTRPALRAALLRETGVELSVSEIGRILRAQELRPHRVRMWLKTQDPDFEPKARRVCSIYLDPPIGRTVVCIDEKRLFAHERKTPLRPARPGRPCQKEFQYRRNGSSTLLAAFDIATGAVIAECRPRRTGDDLVEFLDRVASQINGPVTVIWDNLNVHYDGKDKRWTRFNERHGGRFEFVFTPKHASWLNQVEIWFSILERRVLTNGSFGSVAELEARVMGYIGHWNEVEAHPFRWTFRGSRRVRRFCPLLAHASTPSRRPLARRRAA